MVCLFPSTTGSILERHNARADTQVSGDPSKRGRGNSETLQRTLSANESLGSQNQGQSTEKDLQAYNLPEKNDDPALKCDIVDSQTGVACGRVFKDRAGLTRHRKALMHNPGKPKFECTRCVKKYVYLWDLQRHMREKHVDSWDANGRMSPEEGKGSRTSKSGNGEGKDNLDAQVSIQRNGSPKTRKEVATAAHHPGPSKPFKCTQCGSRFLRATNLQQHIKRVHGLRTAEFSDEESDSSDDEKAEIVSVNQDPSPPADDDKEEEEVDGFV